MVFASLPFNVSAFFILCGKLSVAIIISRYDDRVTLAEQLKQHWLWLGTALLLQDYSAVSASVGKFQTEKTGGQGARI